MIVEKIIIALVVDQINIVFLYVWLMPLLEQITQEVIFNKEIEITIVFKTLEIVFKIVILVKLIQVEILTPIVGLLLIILVILNIV